MKKLLYLTSSIFLFTTVGFVFASSFTIDNLNLREAIPNVNPASSYLKVKLEETWNQINSIQGLVLSPVTIGILDTGVDVNHPEFSGVNWGNTPNGAKSDNGDNGESHGTNVAGIIGANNISKSSPNDYQAPQMNGVLSGVKNLNYILDARTVPKNPYAISPTIQSIFTLSKQIDDVSSEGATIVNISQESSFPFVKNIFHESFLKHPNVLFVVSAGNGGGSVSGGLFSISPAILGTLPNVITVGATTIDDTRYVTTDDNGNTTGSNYGTEVSISAPGDSVNSPTFYHAPLDVTDYEYFNGTSASAPLVTGVAGILKSLKPSLTPAQIKAILIRTADPIVTDQPIGGRLNAYRAVCDPEVGLNCEPALATGILEGHTTQAICDSTEVVIVSNSFVQVFTYDATLDEFNIFVTFRSDNDGFYRSPPFPVGTYYINNRPFMIRVGETTTVDSVMYTLCG